jgi:APA family basic amino acid/polyamine antiporter
MLALPRTTWLRLIVWFVIGIFVYTFYGMRHSKLNRPPPNPGNPGK